MLLSVVAGIYTLHTRGLAACSDSFSTIDRFFFFWKATKDQSDCGDIYLPALSVGSVGFTGTLFTRLFDRCLDVAFTQLFKAARLQADVL